MAITNGTRWHAVSLPVALEALSSTADGLSTEQIAISRARYGTNALPPPKLPSSWHVFLDQFKSPLVAILLVATAIAFSLSEWRDGIVILLVVFLNATIGYRQEEQSDHAVANLLQMTSDQAHVLRGGVEYELPVAELVVGDVVIVETGDRVPADGRWIEALNLRISESSLTGEVVPISKTTAQLPAQQVMPEQRNMGWRGTTVVGGHGRLLITTVGVATRFGAIVVDLESVSTTQTPFQRKLNEFSRRLVIVTLVMGLVVFWLGLARHIPLSTVFLLSVSLIVAVIPEGLPVVITMAMAWGMWAMARRQALVRKLAAVETLGAITVVATDKTGTLTYGEMMVQRLLVDGATYTFDGHGYDPAGDIFRGNAKIIGREDQGISLALRLAALNNDSRFTVDAKQRRIPIGDPTELALTIAAAKGGWSKIDLDDVHPRLGEVPFDAVKKFMITWHPDSHGQTWVTLKGAPHEVLRRCQSRWTVSGPQQLTDIDRSRILESYEGWAEQALRGLAVATMTLPSAPDGQHPQLLDNGYTFVGLFGMADALRPEAAATIATMREAGIATIMVTGDYRQTGMALARQLGIMEHAGPEALIDGSDIDALDDRALSRRLPHLRVATRLTPAHKLRLARLLKQRGEIVAMTGDGINDVPAIAEADVGIAVGRSSSDAAKEAADVILLDGNYQTITAAIMEGRRIFRNIKRAIFYLLASNFGELGLIVMALILGLPLPLLPTQIIWLNAITDPFLGIALAREPISPLVMRERPLDPRASLIDARSWRRIYLAAIAIALGALVVFLIARNAGRPTLEVYAMTLTTIAFAQWVTGLTARSSIRSTFTLFRGNRSLFVAFGVVALLQVAILYIPPAAALFHVAPLTFLDWLLVLVGVFPVLLIEELQKWWRRQLYVSHSVTHLPIP